jgi:hypothetical protein
MKKTFLLTAVLLLLTVTNSFSQGDSRLIFGTPPSTTLIYTFFDPCTGANVNAYVGLLQGTVDGVPNQLFYCVDLCTDVGAGDTLKDSANLAPKLLYVLNNYYPKVTTYPGRLANEYQEAAAIQFALWYLSDGFDLNLYVPDVTLKTRALEIAADADANGGSYVVTSTFTLIGGTNPDDFFVKTLDGNGNPESVASITLTISEGTLSTYTTSTDASGVSPNITVSGASNGAIITATGIVSLPSGSSYVGLTVRRQKLGVPVSFSAISTASTTWGALPVELSAFSAEVNKQDVILSWRTSSESNNAGFDIERKLSGTESWQKVGFIGGNGTSNVPKIYLFTDRNLSSGKYNYRLKQIDFNGNFEYHSLNNLVEIGTPTKFDLSQNYPNPFNPSTKIDFNIPNDGFVSLKVFNISGKDVATLVSEFKTSGYHTINFNASNLSSGIYYYRLESNGISKTMKMALIK